MVVIVTAFLDGHLLTKLIKQLGIIETTESVISIPE